MVLRERERERERQMGFFFFFIYKWRDFQLMASAPNDSSLSSSQDTNQFLV